MFWHFHGEVVVGGGWSFIEELTDLINSFAPFQQVGV
jgi:hypothetical protein